MSLKPHTFYNLLLVPPLVALAGVGISAAWSAYRGPIWAARWLLPVMVAVTAVWAWHVAGRFPTFAPWLPAAIAITGAVAILVTVAGMVVRGTGVAVTAAALALTVALLGPVTWMASVTGKLSVSDAHRPAAGQTNPRLPRLRDLGTTELPAGAAVRPTPLYPLRLPPIAAVRASPWLLRWRRVVRGGSGGS